MVSFCFRDRAPTIQELFHAGSKDTVPSEVVLVSSEFRLTPSQQLFWKQENHNAGKPALALIFPDGTVELDYEGEIILKYKQSKVVE